jgi:hypothetical protein
MTTIITGRFQLQSAADEALAALGLAGFDRMEVATFYVSPAGQQDQTASGSDDDAAVDRKGDYNGALSGAAIGGALGTAMGLAVLERLGPGAAVAAGGVGAYVGSLLGAVGNMHDAIGTPAAIAMTAHLRRHSGMQVAAMAPGAAQQASAVSILRSYGATDIEKPDGNIVAGNWLDFDPHSPLCRVSL